MDFHPGSLASPTLPAALAGYNHLTPTPTATAATTTTTTTTAVAQHLPALSLNTVRETICYLHNYNILVCKEHMTAIQNLDAHLRTHYAVVSKLRKKIVESYQEALRMNPRAYAPGAHLRKTLIGCSLSEGPSARGHMRAPSLFLLLLLQRSSFAATCMRARNSTLASFSLLLVPTERHVYLPIPGRQLHSALSGVLLGTRYTHFVM
jgi:hypothetical protein